MDEPGRDRGRARATPSTSRGCPTTRWPMSRPAPARSVRRPGEPAAAGPGPGGRRPSCAARSASSAWSGPRSRPGRTTSSTTGASTSSGRPRPSSTASCSSHPASVAAGTWGLATLPGQPGRQPGRDHGRDRAPGLRRGASSGTRGSGSASCTEAGSRRTRWGAGTTPTARTRGARRPASGGCRASCCARCGSTPSCTRPTRCATCWTWWATSAVVLGSDHPFEMGDPDPVGSLAAVVEADTATFARVARQNTLRLLGRHAERLRVRGAVTPRPRPFLVLCTHTLLFQAVTFLLRRPPPTAPSSSACRRRCWACSRRASRSCRLAVALPVGDLADRYGESRVMLAGAVVVAASALLLVVWDDTFVALLVGTVLLGTGHLLCAVGQQSMVANLVAPGRFDSAFGYYTFAGTIGQAAGPGPARRARRRSGAPAHPRRLRGRGGDRAGPAAGHDPRAPDAAAATVGTRRADRRVVRLLRTPGLPRALVVSSVVLAAMDITLVYLPALGAEEGLSVGLVGGAADGAGGGHHDGPAVHRALTAWLGRRVLLVVSIGSSGVATALVPLPVPLWLRLRGRRGDGLRPGRLPPATLAWLAEIAPPGMQRPRGVAATGGQPLRPGRRAQRHRPGRRRSRRRAACSG